MNIEQQVKLRITMTSREKTVVRFFLNCFKCLKCGVWVVVNVTSDGGDDEVRPDQCG